MKVLGPALLSALSALTPARTEAKTIHSPIEVDTEQCRSLAGAEVGRLLEVELASVAQEIRDGPPLQVVLSCDENIEISVHDPLTGKRLIRAIPSPPLDEPGSERVVALAIAQLFAASWLELLLAEREPIPGVAPTNVNRDATDAARSTARRRIDGRRSEVEILVGGGMRLRSIGLAGFPAGHIELVIRGWLHTHWSIMGVATFEGGRAHRIVGDVHALAVLTGIGVGWRWPSRRIVGAVMSLVLAGGYARLRGVAADSSTPAFTTQGATGDVAYGIGPRLDHRRFRLELVAQVGGTLRDPVGLVVGDDDVSLGGFWAGATLRLGLDATPARNRSRP